MQQEDIHTNAVKPLLKNFLMIRIPQRWICHTELVSALPYWSTKFSFYYVPPLLGTMTKLWKCITARLGSSKSRCACNRVG